MRCWYACKFRERGVVFRIHRYMRVACRYRYVHNRGYSSGWGRKKQLVLKPYPFFEFTARLPLVVPQCLKQFTHVFSVNYVCFEGWIASDVGVGLLKIKRRGKRNMTPSTPFGCTVAAWRQVLDRTSAFVRHAGYYCPLERNSMAIDYYLWIYFISWAERVDKTVNHPRIPQTQVCFYAFI